ncbi:MAG TPA: DUF503 domain-containing protein [Desulfuromonadales bacterium]
MVVGVLRLDLILYSPGSLKEKRGVVRSILGRCRSRFPVSCAETGLQDLWQRAELGFAMVGLEEAAILRTFDLVEEEIARSGAAETGERLVEFFHY